MSEESRRIYEFGPFRLDTAEHCLYRNGQAVHLEQKVYQTLLALVQQSGHLMKKEVLIDLVWPDNVVEEVGLPRNIHHLRRVLGDEAAAPKYIETVPRLGYRFIAEVREVQPEEATANRTEPKSASPSSESQANSAVHAEQALLPSDESSLRPVAGKWKRRYTASAVAVGLAGLLAIGGLVLREPKPIPGPKLPLQTYEFDVVTLDAQGNEKERRRGQAQAFAEDLGGGVKLEMVSIPTGVFLMGTSEAEVPQVEQEYMRHLPPERKAEVRAWVSTEMPQHLVKVAAFFLGKYEITQAQWRTIAKTPKINYDLTEQPSQVAGDNLPVTYISWVEATEFCARLARETDRPYRLPSEAEWEYACRARTMTAFHFGETITTKYVNHNGKYPYGQAPAAEYRGQPVSVGSLGTANAFGLHDMHGNVWEWCLDTMYWTYEDAPDDGRAWGANDERKGVKVVRGGAFGNDNPPGKKFFFFNFCAFDCRSARRNAAPKFNRNPDLGFRVAMSLNKR